MRNRLFQCLLTYLRRRNDIVLARQAAYSNIYNCIFTTDTSMHLLWASRIGGRCSFLPPSQLARRFYSSTHSWSYLAPDVAGRRAEALAAGDAEKSDDGPMSIATKLSHAGIEDLPNAPMAPPIHLATTYTRPADGNYLANDSIYSRYDNPTRLLLEKTVFDLETHGLQEKFAGEQLKSGSFSFASGQMAATAVILAHKTPLTVILPNDLYHGITTLLVDIFSRHGVNIETLDMTDIPQILKKINDVSVGDDVIVWMETPSNPKCQIIDIAAVCEAVAQVSSHKVTTVVDVTMSSPVVTRPIELGADIAMHSGTKFMAGHSDALLGILTASPITLRGKELTETLRTVQIMAGGVASPWDAWLCLRGLRTLQVRLEQQSRTAQVLSEYLEGHELVERVHYPGLISHPQHTVARRQMAIFGGILSVELKDETMATAFAAALLTIHRATSLGGTETLIEHRASIEPPDRRTSPPGLLRISVGLEDEEDLIRDISKALSVVQAVVSDQDKGEN